LAIALMVVLIFVVGPILAFALVMTVVWGIGAGVLALRRVL
jgi:hypothetical protein